MTKLSVNVNKIATLRNARGGSNPNVVQMAAWAEQFGADGITVHPRPDQRHITTDDVYALAASVKSEFNIEGYPDARYLQLVEDVRPAQATLVPDGPDVITSNAGWDTLTQRSLLAPIVEKIKDLGVRVSIFVDPEPKHVQGAADLGSDRIELYTEGYAIRYSVDPSAAIAPYEKCAQLAKDLSLGVNAGHDLNLENLAYLKKTIPFLDEVSIGHALVADALIYGWENTIAMYQRKLQDQ